MQHGWVFRPGATVLASLRAIVGAMVLTTGRRFPPAEEFTRGNSTAFLKISVFGWLNFTMFPA